MAALLIFLRKYHGMIVDGKFKCFNAVYIHFVFLLYRHGSMSYYEKLLKHLNN